MRPEFGGERIRRNLSEFRRIQKYQILFQKNEEHAKNWTAEVLQFSFRANLENFFVGDWEKPVLWPTQKNSRKKRADSTFGNEKERLYKKLHKEVRNMVSHRWVLAEGLVFIEWQQEDRPNTRNNTGDDLFCGSGWKQANKANPKKI